MKKSRKSRIINLNGATKKFVRFSAVGLCITSVFYFNIYEYAFAELADLVFASEKSYDITNEIFSLDGKTVLKDMTRFGEKEETNEKNSVILTQNSPENQNLSQKSEETEKIPEVTPESGAVDISKDKPADSVTANNIIVSNAPKKSFDIAELLSRPLSYTKGEGYKVLIIHTHTTEAYLPNDRSENQAENIVRVGDEFTKILNESRIKTLHCKTVHDAPYSKSYINELASIEKILAENPSIEVVIDVHRDGLYNSKNEKLRPAVIINGESTAQVMLVCGTNASGLQHNTWESCFSFALKIQDNMNRNYPSLARPVNLRTERFNTHLTKNSVIFEIGANGNTLSEAINGAKYAAQAIADVLNGK